MPRPNILFIMTDQQRADAMGCSGGWVETPNLDRIAAEGVRFSNAVTTAPLCVPARVSLLTGRYPHNTGIRGNVKHDLEPHTPSWWRAVREAGYRTSLFGKTHLHHHDGDLRDREHLLRAYGMDDIDEIPGPNASLRCLSHMTARWEELGLWQKIKEDYKDRGAKGSPARPSVLPFEEYADVYVGQRTKRYLADYNHREPWFCHVSFGGPHAPWDAPEPYASRYRPEDMPEPVDSRATLRCGQAGGRLGNSLAKAATNAQSKDEIAAKRANYAGNVTLIDDQIGQILDVIEQRGELDNTVIVFTSDHGELNGDHGLFAKRNFLNGSVRVPLLVRTPETAAERAPTTATNDSPVEWIDIGPTLVELAGGEIPHAHFARSLLPAVTNPEKEHRSFAISEIGFETMILSRRWKLIFNQQGEPYLLFDQEKDPEEKHNLLEDPGNTEIVGEMRTRLFQHLIRTQIDITGNAASTPPSETD